MPSLLYRKEAPAADRGRTSDGANPSCSRREAGVGAPYLTDAVHDDDTSTGRSALNATGSLEAQPFEPQAFFGMMNQLNMSAGAWLHGTILYHHALWRGLNARCQSQTFRWAETQNMHSVAPVRGDSWLHQKPRHCRFWTDTRIAAAQPRVVALGLVWAPQDRQRHARLRSPL